jgi:hypothetical protein
MSATFVFAELKLIREKEKMIFKVIITVLLKKTGHYTSQPGAPYIARTREG